MPAMNIRYLLFIFLCCGICGAPSCEKDEVLPETGRKRASASFAAGKAVGKAEAAGLNEVSGIACSAGLPGVIWAHNDSGDAPRFFAMTEEGRDLAVYYLRGAVAHDWEDMASGPGPRPGKQYLYFGDIGDNKAGRSHITVYRVEEPAPVEAAEGLQGLRSDTLPGSVFDAFHLKYPNGPRDAETLLVDPISGSLFIVSKREKAVGVYKADLPARPADTLVLERVAELPYTGMTGGDISAAGDGILLKSYKHLFYWSREPGETVGEALQRKPRRLNYTPEPQGEAVAWKKDGSGFFTLSEEVLGIDAVLYWYKRR